MNGPRVHFDADTPVSRAANAGLHAVGEALGEEWLRARDAMIVVVVQARELPGDAGQNNVIAGWNTNSDAGPAQVVAALTVALKQTLRSLGKQLMIVPIGRDA